MHILYLIAAVAALLFLADHFNLSARLKTVEAKLAALVPVAVADVESAVAKGIANVKAEAKKIEQKL